MDKNICIGIDIGTTTISAVVLQTDSGFIREIRCIQNDSPVPAAYPWEHKQDPQWILETTTALLDGLMQQFPETAAIGLTGQMHGILYVDQAGKAVSPLYTWQDSRAAPALCRKMTACTGYVVSPGYGLATHKALMESGEVPETAASLCTVMDYLAMAWTGNARPVMHTTNAASLGFFDREKGEFDKGALGILHIEASLLPAVTGDCRIAGVYKGIPVMTAIGDNQAAFLGAVQEPEAAVLVNMGTGSQISLCMAPEEASALSAIAGGSVETRPYLEDKILVSGSGLCGGRAYAILEKFFRRTAAAMGLPEENRYSLLNALAAEGWQSGKTMHVRTTFCGTRTEPDLRGQITDIGEEDLTPEGLAAGVLYGMAEELYGMLQAIPHKPRTVLIGSGNGIRKNPVLQQIFSDRFGLPLQMPAHTEEAAFGAALFAACGTGITDVSHCIRYTMQNP